MSSPGTTTSGVTDFDPPASDVLTAAFRIMGVINDTETPDASMEADGLSTLNSMMKELEATGIHVWTEQELILFLRQGQERYLLSAKSADHFADAYSYSLDALASNAAAGATSVTLTTSALGQFFAKGNQIGINLDSGDAFWTTVSAAPSGLVVPLTAALPSSASTGEFTYAYVSNPDRPLRVPAARRIAYGIAPQGSIETPLTNMLSRKAYMDLPNKKTLGTLTQVYYNPARDTGEMYVWPAPQNTTQGLRFTGYRPVQIFQSITDLADLPQEWGNALKWALAAEMGPRYSVPAERYDRIVQRSAGKIESVMGWDREPESIYFGRSYDQTSRSAR